MKFAAPFFRNLKKAQLPGDGKGRYSTYKNQPRRMSQPNKIAIVTGAGSGIGRAVAIALLNDGWSVVLAGRRETPLIETANACNISRTLVVPADITNAESVQHLFSQA